MYRIENEMPSMTALRSSTIDLHELSVSCYRISKCRENAVLESRHPVDVSIDGDAKEVIRKDRGNILTSERETIFCHLFERRLKTKAAAVSENRSRRFDNEQDERECKVFQSSILNTYRGRVAVQAQISYNDISRILRRHLLQFGRHVENGMELYVPPFRMPVNG